PRGSERRNNMKHNVDADGRVFYSIKSNGKLYKYYEDEPIYPTDVWTDIGHLHQKDSERVNYPTQKPKELLRRILLASSYENALVCDFFSGSGTTAIVAEELNRRWLAVDSSPFAAFTLRKRLIDLHSKGGLLLAKNSTAFEYQKRLNKLDLGIQTNESNSLIITSKNENKIEQASIGFIENETFFPTKHISPNKNAQIYFGGLDENSVVHIIDSGGKHGFYRIR
ncbi:MAG: site-specific DNA-methyltransferase, partial [Clostridiales bacterium]|nr:site-specific DNA-methyltransferase [Clostridiales bacterium]